jgi:hypothetical protein
LFLQSTSAVANADGFRPGQPLAFADQITVSRRIIGEKPTLHQGIFGGAKEFERWSKREHNSLETVAVSLPGDHGELRRLMNAPVTFC